MIDLLATWSRLGDDWLDWMLARSVVCAVTLAIVGGVILLLRGRVSAHLPSRLLLLPIAVLFVPLERALPEFWPEPLPTIAAPRFDHGPGASGVALIASPDAAPPSEREPGSRAAPTARDVAIPDVTLGAPALAMTVWLAVLGLGIVRLIVRQRRADRALRRTSLAIDPHAAHLLQPLAGARRLDERIELRSSPRLSSPVVTGMLRPIVYLPVDIATRLSPTQLRFVLLHELEHVRRRDVLTEAFMRVAQLGWFFHPGVWITKAAFDRWREYACDEAALARAGATARTSIADALFTLIDHANDAPRPAGVCLLSTREFMKSRLCRILDRSIAPRRRLTPSSTLALALTALGALTAARAQQTPALAVVDATQDAPPATNDDVGVVLDQATTWLLRAQQEDGRWAIRPEPGGANQRDHNEVHVTGLAIRALLPNLRGRRQEEVAGAIARGVKFLEDSQQASGCFGTQEPYTLMYGHAQALRALCAVQRVWPDDARLAKIEAGVRYAESARNPYMGWRYMPRSGENDSKITSLMLLALHDAAELQLELPARGVESARLLLEQLTDEATGRTGFVRRGEPMSRFTSKKGGFPGEFSEEPTAMKLLVDLAYGERLAESVSMRRAVDLLVVRPPEWSVERGSIDYAYWEFGAEAIAGVGASQAELWRDRLRSALIPHRIVADGAAHWPAIDAWSHPGMEVYATASAMLALQALR